MCLHEGESDPSPGNSISHGATKKKKKKQKNKSDLEDTLKKGLFPRRGQGTQKMLRLYYASCNPQSEEMPQKGMGAHQSILRGNLKEPLTATTEAI